MSSVTFSPSVGGDGSTVTDDSNATTGLDGGGHRTRFVPALAQVVAVAAHTVTKAGEASASAGAAASSASSAAAQAGLTTAAGAAQVALAAAHVATASSQATASATSASQAAASAAQAAASAAGATGPAGGVLSGTYPNPGFAVDMATQGELNAVAAAKQDTLVSGTTIKTINSTSLMGSGDITVGDATGSIKHSYTSPGAGWLECNGAVYLQSSYASLYAAIGLLPNMSGYRNQSNMQYAWDSTSLGNEPPEQVTPVVNTGTALVFIATRSSSGVFTICFRSTDGGLSWSQTQIAAFGGEGVSKLAYGNGRLIAAKGVGSTSQYWTSDDHGVTWTARSYGATLTTWDIYYGGGKWVHNGSRYSTDGTTWTLGPAPVGMYQIANNGTTWVGVQGGVYTSPDGINWTAVSGITIDPAGYDYHRKSLIYANGAFWVIANYQQSGAHTGESARSWQLLRSTDGQNWTAVAAPKSYFDSSSNMQIGSPFEVLNNQQMHLFSGLGMIGVSVGHHNGKVSNYVTKDLVTWEVLHTNYNATFINNADTAPAPFVFTGDRFGMVIFVGGTPDYVYVHKEMKPRITYSTSTQFAVPHIVPGADGRKAYIKA